MPLSVPNNNIKGQIKVAEVPDIKKEHTFIIPLDPKGKLTVKIDLHRQMTQKEIEGLG